MINVILKTIRHRFSLAIVFAPCLLLSCKKFVEVGFPETALVGNTVFQSEATATAVITGIYGRMMSTQGNFASGNAQSVSFLTALSADDLATVRTDIQFRQFNDNAIASDNSFVSLFLWNEVYQYIYTANQVIENMGTAENLSLKVRSQLEGEARFIRAFCHFYLTNIFGGIPLVQTTDHLQNTKIAQSPVNSVYESVISDLQQAVQLLSDDYLDATNQPTMERVRPNKRAAEALLARVYLFNRQWEKAEETATAILGDTRYQLASLDQVFLKNSTESIWQLQPVVNGLNTWEGFTLVQPFTPSYAVITESLLSAFQSGDQRVRSWVMRDSTGQAPYAYPYKYKVRFQDEKREYSMVLRLAELYLIRAEARIQQGNIPGGTDDLNIIRTRASDQTAPINEQLPLLPASMTVEEALNATLQERRTELFTEWGHRWFDLKRTNKLDEALHVLKGANWQSTDALFPIPQSELNSNPLLIQNAGY